MILTKKDMYHASIPAYNHLHYVFRNQNCVHPWHQLVWSPVETLTVYGKLPWQVANDTILKS